MTQEETSEEERPKQPLEYQETQAETRVAAREAALEAIRELQKMAEKPGEITLSNGIVLKLKSPPQNLIREAAARVPIPKIPMSHNEDKGRDEENPLDPEYLQALEDRETAQYLATSDVALMMGTECLSVPDTMFPVEADDWIEYLRILGYDELADLPPMREGKPCPPRRWWAWLRLYALRTQEDIAATLYGTMMLCQLTEEEVALAVASFRSFKRRGADPDGADEEHRQDGDPVPGAVPGDGERAGGEGGGEAQPDPVAAMEAAVAG